MSLGLYKTITGAWRRAYFETAVSAKWKYFPLRYYRGARDLAPFQQDRVPDYTWRVHKVKKEGV